MLLADIRFCTQEDVRRVLEVDKTSPHPWPDRIIARDLMAGSIGLSYLGAFAPGQSELLGYAVLGDEKGNGLLMNLVVLPNYRRRSIGSQLVVSVAECAAELGFPSLILRVRQTNLSAVALYKDLGFKNHSVLERYYSNSDSALQMNLKLPLVLEEA